MKSVAVVSVLAAVAYAQSSNPLIPSGISSGCTSYLTALNTDTSISSCTTPLIAATKAFGPTASSSNTSSAAVTSALSTLCGSSTSSCTATLVKAELAKFYSACSAELTSNPNDDVIRTYDVLYSLIPFKQAACTIDDNGKYCITEATSNTKSDAVVVGTAKSTGSSLWESIGNLRKRASDQTPAIVPNVTTYQATNILFLFLEPSLATSALCTTCTRDVLTSYINFESQVPYAPGLTNSLLLAGQTALYNAIQKGCGSSFLSGAVQAAGGLKAGIGASSGAIATDIGGLFTAVMGMASLAAAMVL